MPVELRLPNRLTLSVVIRLLTGVIVAVLLSATSAMAGALEDPRAAVERKDYATAFTLVRPLAEQGDAKAQTLLGELYGVYALGNGIDLAEAAKWYRRAADQGNAEAQWRLAQKYYFDEDYAQAVAWSRKAADQGHAFGQLFLGMMYRDGQGVPQDYVIAHMWFNLAAAADGSGAKSRDDIAAKMTPAQIAEAQRMASEWVPKK